VKQTKFDEILAAHELWLNTEGREGARANLIDANLSGANLIGAVLRGADLSKDVDI
jgi:uncharacterized protein YjbI with pentapeptide repeats